MEALGAPQMEDVGLFQSNSTGSPAPYFYENWHVEISMKVKRGCLDPGAHPGAPARDMLAAGSFSTTYAAG